MLLRSAMKWPSKKSHHHSRPATFVKKPGRRGTAMRAGITGSISAVR